MSQEDKDLDKELAALLATMSPDVVRALLGSEEKKTATVVEGGRVFIHIVRHNHCLHCGASWDRMTSYERKESMTYMDSKGRLHTVPVRDKAEIDVYHNYCDKCGYFIKSLEREDLEGRYLQLLKVCGHELMTQSMKEKKGGV